MGSRSIHLPAVAALGLSTPPAAQSVETRYGGRVAAAGRHPIAAGTIALAPINITFLPLVKAGNAIRH